MVRYLIFLFAFILSLQVQAQSTDCSSQAVRDSLFRHYARKAHSFGMDQPGWAQTFDTLISICPNISEAYQERGLAYIRSKDFDNLFRNIDKAVELEPARWIAYRGYLHCILAGNYEKAIADFETAEKMMPHAFTMDHTFSFFTALAYMGLGKFESAEAYFQKDISTQQRGEAKNDIHYNSLLYYGIMYYKMNELDQAEQRLAECLQLYDSHPTANYYMGMIRKITGSPQKDSYFQKARQALTDGYQMNEPNSHLIPYPLQVTLADLDNH